MRTVTLSESESRLGELVDRVQQGEDVTIHRNGRPAARMVAVEQDSQNNVSEIFARIERRRRDRGGIDASLEEVLAFRRDHLRA